MKKLPLNLSKKNCLLLIALFTGLNLTPGYSQNWDGTVLGFDAPPGALLGDMFGLRPALEERGFHYTLGYLSQISYNAAGGADRDKHAAYIDQFSLTFTQDLERLTGIPDAQIDGNIVDRNHDDSLTTKRLKDKRVNFTDVSQESYGGQSITRLGWLTFSRTFDDRRLLWRIGMMNKLQDFDQIIPCDFQLLSQCGGKSAYSMTWYNWNVHYWGTTLQYHLTDELTLKGGILEQNPQAPSRGQAWSGSMRGTRGMLIPVELELKTHINDLPGIYNLALLFTNSRQKDLSKGVSQDRGADDSEGYRTHNHTWFLYTGFNQQLTRGDGDLKRGLSTSWSLGLSDPRSNYIHLTAAGSLRYHGLFDARPEDWLGFGVTYSKLSNHYRANQKALNILHGVNDFDNPLYSPVPGHAMTAELYYRLRVTPWLELQPDLQYWYRPGGLKETRDAWVTGLKTVLTF